MILESWCLPLLSTLVSPRLSLHLASSEIFRAAASSLLLGEGPLAHLCLGRPADGLHSPRTEEGRVGLRSTDGTQWGPEGVCSLAFA